MAEPALHVEAIVLAAGLSRRMGETNKLLLDWQGEPLVRRTLRQLIPAVDSVLVVLGHEAEAVGRVLSDLPVRTIVNPAFEEGQQSSVRAGLAAAALDGEAVMIALADQPFLRRQDYRELIDTFAASAAGDHPKALIPCHDGARGNPILMPTALVRQLTSDGRSPACRKFLDANPHLIHWHGVDHDRFTADLDTPEDLDAFLRRTPGGHDHNPVHPHGDRL
jgi:molybdenum cofactor cytidylyltransferase